MLWHYIEVLENTVLFPLKKVSKSNHKYERINQIAAGIILERYDDTFRSWYGEFTRLD